MRRVLLVVGLVLAGFGHHAPAIEADDAAAPSAQAVTLLKAVEARRLQTPTVRLTYSYSEHDRQLFSRLTVELDAEYGRYRIVANADGSVPQVSVFDGEKLLQYDGDASAVIATLTDPPPGFCFDPLAIGIIPIYNAWLVLGEQIAYRTAQQVRLLPRETFEGVPTEVMATIVHDGPETFRNRLYGGTIERVGPFPESNWTLKGLNLRHGQPVVDLRIKERIGYWRSDGVLTDDPVALPMGDGGDGPAAQAATSWGNRRFLLVVNAALLASVLGYLFARRRKSS